VRVLVADKFEKTGIEGLAKCGCGVANEPEAGAKDLAGAIARHDPEVLIVRSSKVTAPTIASAKSLKLIVRAGSGVDNIDVPAASAKGIAVCNCLGMNAVAVAELTFGLLLCCDRRIPDQCASLKAGQWNKKEFGKARGLKGLTLGVAGVGAIGQELVVRAKAFGMHVVAWSRGITLQHAAALGVEFLGTDTPALIGMARRADVVSVHLPLMDSTRRIFNKSFFDEMKPGAYFLNTSRGGVVDEAALREAIASKGLRVGLDVYDGQPSEAACAWNCDLAKLPGVYTTHHCGASTDQAQQAVAEEAVRVVCLWKSEGRLVNCVNEDAVGVGQ
jgi:D-3-phosphoglycerate dehydrogenase